MSVLSSTSCGLATAIKNTDFFVQRGYKLINPKTGFLLYSKTKFISKDYYCIKNNEHFFYSFSYNKNTYYYFLYSMEEVVLLEQYFKEKREKHKKGLLQKMMKQKNCICAKNN